MEGMGKEKGREKTLPRNKFLVTALSHVVAVEELPVPRTVCLVWKWYVRG